MLCPGTRLGAASGRAVVLAAQRSRRAPAPTLSCDRVPAPLPTPLSTAQGLHLYNTSTGDKSDLPVAGLFYGIGHQPNSKLVAGQVQLDEAGYVLVSV